MSNYLQCICLLIKTADKPYQLSRFQFCLTNIYFIPIKVRYLYYLNNKSMSYNHIQLYLYNLRNIGYIVYNDIKIWLSHMMSLCYIFKKGI